MMLINVTVSGPYKKNIRDSGPTLTFLEELPAQMLCCVLEYAFGRR
jgi:hypothetical protein